MQNNFKHWGIFMFNNKLTYKLFLSVLVTFSFSFIAFAQEIEEVVVTATKKEESIQDLAFSIESLSSDDLIEAQIYDLQDLQEVIPGFIADKGVASGGLYSLRGLLSRNISSASVDALSFNINGHSINSSSMTNIGFFDIERIEVKKGPVGTLNGRSGALGKIDVITARPTDELSGSIDAEFGNYDSTKYNTVINVPVSDTVKTRLAVMSFQRDGMMYNSNPAIDAPFDDRNDIAGRISIDWDIGDASLLKFTYSINEADDNRTQQDLIYCAQDPFFGCSPFSRGVQGASADSRGEVDGLLALVAFAQPSTGITNAYPLAGSNAELGVMDLNRSPVHKSKNEFTNLEFVHDISEELQFVAKYSYGTRKFVQIDDNDMSRATVPFIGPLGPVASEVCFRDFCEYVDSARKYSMIHIDYENKNFEMNLISNYDGPVNFTVGVYNYLSKNDNETNIATGAGGMLSDVGDHAYFPTLQLFSGGQIVAGEGGAAYFQNLATWFATLQFFGPTNLLTQRALAIALDNSGKTTPRDGHGLIIDNHISIEEKSIFGEVYYDISDNTKLTLGLRYDEADVSQTQINDRFGSIFHANPFTTDALLSREQRDVPFFTTTTASPADGTAYKIALQHNLNDNSMVYASFSTAMKPGGINTGNNNQVLEEENVDNFEFGLKSILANGAVLLNTTFFSTNIDNYQVGVIVDTGSDAANASAEMQGFEGNLSAFLSENTRIDFNWLLTDAEFSEDAFIIDYLNPGAWVEGAAGGRDYGFYQAADPAGLGLYYTAVGVTASGEQVQVFKQAGFSCLVLADAQGNILFSPLTNVNCPEGQRGIAQNVKGNPLPGTPELSYSLSFNQSFTTANGSVNSKLTYRYQDQYSGDAFNTERARNQAQDFFDFLVTYVPNDGDWYFGIYAKNLEDQRYLTSPGTQSNVQGGGVVWQVNDPSIYGIQFGTSF